MNRDELYKSLQLLIEALKTTDDRELKFKINTYISDIVDILGMDAVEIKRIRGLNSKV